MMAFFRAQHHLHDEPKLFDDPYAHRLLTAAEMAAFTERFVRDGLEMGVAPGDPQAVLARSLREASGAAAVLSRARYTEDRLALAVERGVAQYVLVGAGLDTFAFRAPTSATESRSSSWIIHRARPSSASGSPPPASWNRRTVTLGRSTSSARVSPRQWAASRFGPTNRQCSPGSG